MLKLRENVIGSSGNRQKKVLLKNVETSRKCVFYMGKLTENCILMYSDGLRIIFLKEVKPTEYDFLPDSLSAVGFQFCPHCGEPFPSLTHATSTVIISHSYLCKII